MLSTLEIRFRERLRVEKMESELVELQQENEELKLLVSKQKKKIKKLHKKCKKQ